MNKVYETITVERCGATHRLTLNRPENLNCLTPLMVQELLDYWGDLYDDLDTHLVILSGAGDHFTGGLDIKEPLPVLDTGPAGAMNFMRDYGELVLRMRRCPQPIVALIKGAAAGGGLAFALASDIRIAGESLRMNAAFVRLGLSGTEMGISYLLPRLVGGAIASELCFTGRFVNADEALKLGLVSRVVPDECLSDAGDEIISQILANDPFAIRMTKEALNATYSIGSLEAAIALENRNQSLAFVSRAPREGVTAFKEKRTPKFG